MSSSYISGSNLGEYIYFYLHRLYKKLLIMLNLSQSEFCILKFNSIVYSICRKSIQFQTLF